MATIERIGFGQVEPNHLSAQRTAQIYAQLPANKDIKILENGQFVKYDYAKGEVNFEGAGEWMMVFNEVKLYDDFWRETYKDFAMREGKGVVICNPPYGERLLDVKEAQQIYRTMGKVFKNREKDRFYVISPDDNFEKFFGRRADKRRKLYNGMIKCQVYQYFK